MGAAVLVSPNSTRTRRDPALLEGLLPADR